MPCQSCCLSPGSDRQTELVERDGRIYWSDKYLDTPEDRAIMDVTATTASTSGGIAPRACAPNASSDVDSMFA